jgi:sulfur relay (sulfurtransferase) complex TusBCD TusD component (DsrE family)
LECSEIGFSLFICSCEVKRQHILAWDGVSAAKKGQNPPEGYYNLEKMLCDLVKAGARVRACGTYLRARALGQEDLVEGVEVGTMMELAKWVKESRLVLSF